MDKLKSLKIYELYPEVNDQNYYAIHTLIQLYSDKDYLKHYPIRRLDETFNKIKSIKEFLSEFSICPYLMLNNLDDNQKEKRVLDKIIYGIIPNFKFDNEPKEIIRKINPFKNKKFIENLLHTIKYNSSGEFKDSSKAEKLFYLYADKNHIPWLVKDLKSISIAYNDSRDARDSLDD
ncbi:MAG: hypothetical protein Q8O84_02760 [Nanoarchaeota archaeon]|nr:hypothetical protein [Nanoarchaeota archaeon]